MFNWVCVECLIGKQNKPTLCQVTEPSSVPYLASPACAKMAANPDPPLVILLPESSAAQVQASPGRGLFAEQAEMSEFRTWVGSGPKCFQVLGLSSSLLLLQLQNPML